MSIRIVSDGSAIGTRVYQGDTEITSVSAIQVRDIRPGGSVSATLTFDLVCLDMELDQLHYRLSEDGPTAVAVDKIKKKIQDVEKLIDRWENAGGEGQ